MEFRIPVIYGGVFIALVIFYYFGQKAKINRAVKREHQEERKRIFMEDLINCLPKKDNDKD